MQNLPSFFLPNTILMPVDGYLPDLLSKKYVCVLSSCFSTILSSTKILILFKLSSDFPVHTWWRSNPKWKLCFFKMSLDCVEQIYNRVKCAAVAAYRCVWLLYINRRNKMVASIHFNLRKMLFIKRIFPFHVCTSLCFYVLS